jgi:hypothetical protein
MLRVLLRDALDDMGSARTTDRSSVVRFVGYRLEVRGSLRPGLSQMEVVLSAGDNLIQWFHIEVAVDDRGDPRCMNGRRWSVGAARAPGFRWLSQPV